jgi:dihydrofolate reductase
VRVPPAAAAGREHDGRVTTITLIAAVSANGVIGREGDLAWRHREDLQRVKRLTLGRTLVMGRRTFDSIGRPLPGRRTIVITRQAGWAAPGVSVTHSVEEALEAARDTPEIVVFGGGELYAQLISRAHRLEITHIRDEIDGDTHFPAIDPTVWREVDREERGGFAWVTYTR